MKPPALFPKLVPKLAVALALSASLVGCDTCRSMFWAAASRMDSGNMGQYTEKLQAQHTDTALELDHCDMLGESRNGYCLLRGAADQAERFVEALPVERKSAEERVGGGFYEHSCASVEPFGRHVDGRTYALRSDTQWFPIAGTREEAAEAIPSNDDNVHLRAVYLAPGASEGTAVCVQYEFPYG